MAATQVFPFVSVSTADPRLLRVRYLLTPQDLVPVEESAESILEIVERKLPTERFQPRSIEEILAWQEGPPAGEFLVVCEDDCKAEKVISGIEAALHGDVADFSLGRVLMVLFGATGGFVGVEVLVVIPDVAVIQSAWLQ